MLLTVSKRLEFSASRRLFVKQWSDADNLAAFGPETAARYGTGRNYVAYFVFSGAVDPATGMLMNISEIKERVGQVLHDGFDHKFLNEDNPAFATVPPTAENVARELFVAAAPLFKNGQAELAACHLSESEDRSATYYSSGISEANYWFEFSAARQTMSPQLSSAENEKLFGAAASPFGHGHNYRARVTLPGDRDPSRYGAVAKCLDGIRNELDHKNLNREVRGLANQPITTEILARYLHQRAAEAVTPRRIADLVHSIDAAARSRADAVRSRPPARALEFLRRVLERGNFLPRFPGAVQRRALPGERTTKRRGKRRALREVQ